jgi:acyl carrier protein
MLNPIVDNAVRAWLQKQGPMPAEGADLHEAGLLDSVALVDLLGTVEAATGKEIDLLEVDLDRLTTRAAVVAELSRALAASEL